MSGASEFKVKINRLAVADIVEKSKQLRLSDMEFVKNAPYEDVQAAYVLTALAEFLKERRCEPDFEVVLSE